MDQLIFGDFINNILTEIENHPVQDGHGNNKCKLWDNISLHKTNYVKNIIRDRVSANNFFTVNRPPYQPKLAPIQCIFCELAAELTRCCQRYWTIETLRANIYNILSNIGSNGKFHITFVRCGYPVHN